MTTYKLVLATLVVLLISGPKAFSGIGNEGSGGGDLCEDQIQIIRSDIASWIQKGGHKNLKLPQNINEEQYKTEMLKYISEAKIRCIGESDKDYPVEVYGTPKVCRFDNKRFKKPVITCDREAFMKMNETNQYVLVHHEYAGLSNVEIPNKDDSQYQVSNQISSYLVDTIVKRLAVKPQTPDQKDTSLPLPLQGWKILGGDQGVQTAKAIQDALANTQFEDCRVEAEITPTPNMETVQCGSSEYYDLTFTYQSIQGSGLGFRNMPVGLFNCTPNVGHTGHSLLQSNEQKNIYKNVVYKDPMYREDNEWNFLLALETFYEFDSSETKLNKVTIIKSKIVDVNIGTISTPKWKKESVVLKQLTCNAE